MATIQVGAILKSPSCVCACVCEGGGELVTENKCIRANVFPIKYNFFILKIIHVLFNSLIHSLIHSHDLYIIYFWLASGVITESDICVQRITLLIY